MSGEKTLGSTNDNDLYGPQPTIYNATKIHMRSLAKAVIERCAQEAEKCESAKAAADAIRALANGGS